MNYQLSRRDFLNSSVVIALLQLLGGCSSADTISQILFLDKSLPPQLIREFRKSLTNKVKVEFKPQTHISQIFDSLFTLQHNKKQDPELKIVDSILNKPEVYPNLTTLGDAWLASAINQNLIQPLSVQSLTSWQNLPKSWQKLVRRNSQGNLTDDGAIYGAPYRWGSTVIAYRSDKLDPLEIQIQDWQDLWQPALKDRISLLDSPREVIGLVLKRLGKSYNTEDLQAVPQLETELLALHQQAKLYSSDHYLEPLVLGDTWAAVAWSTDILPLLKRYPEIKFIIPQSGTSLWADLWVKPKLLPGITQADEQDQSPVVAQWIDYCWQPETAIKISIFTAAISPIIATLTPQEIPASLQDNVFVNSDILNSDKSEFLLPLSPATAEEYRQLWLKIRQ